MKSRLPFIIGLTILVFLSTMAVLAPVMAPGSPTHQDLGEDLHPPSREFLLGTDKLGRDVASRVIYGARISLLVGISTVGVSLLIGVLVGALAGYFGGWIDQILMRIVDILLAFPGTLLAIAFTAVLGPGLVHVVLALCLISWTGYARLVRGEILSLREKDFVLAAKALGGTPRRVILLHMVPNLLPSLLIQSTFGMAAAIIAEGALSFLGLGAQPPTPSWGSILNEGRQFLLVAPHLTTFPGLAIMIAVLGLNLVGDGLMALMEKREN
ncbi:MAG: ABC transporter permease [Candidatus Binatia bacterium]|nr:ABC transporter permease [Candidatus Binatia bacterium]